jgi:hypothetical protein
MERRRIHTHTISFFKSACIIEMRNTFALGSDIFITHNSNGIYNYRVDYYSSNKL